MALYLLSKSFNKNKKWQITTPSGKKINFGAKGYEDYTTHKDKERMNRYTNRHASRENWKKSGINTAGFWAKWLLWNKPSLTASIKATESKFNIKIRKFK